MIHTHIRSIQEQLQYVVVLVQFTKRKSFYLLVMALSSPVGCVRLKLSPTLGFSGPGLIVGGG